jgi:hypothetical protein
MVARVTIEEIEGPVGVTLASQRTNLVAFVSMCCVLQRMHVWNASTELELRMPRFRWVCVNHVF